MGKDKFSHDFIKETKASDLVAKILAPLALISLLLISACGQQAPGDLQPSSFTPTLQPSSFTPTQENVATETEAGFQLPGGRLLFSALESQEVRDADPDYPFFNEYFWLNLPDMTVESHPLLSGIYPIRDFIAALSPDQGHIAFERQSYTQAGDNLYSGVSSLIYISGPDDDEGTQIGQPFSGDYVLGTSWSLDSHLFAYWRGLDWRGIESEHDIYLYDVASGSLKTLTIQATQPESAALSPDGEWIAFTSFGEIPGLNLINTDGSNQRMLIEGAINGMAWHPDGKRIFFVQFFPESGIFSVDVANGAITLITTTSERARWPDISPDGSLLAYDDSGIAVVNTEGGTSVQLTRGGGMTEWAWSPDSQYIAYISYQETSEIFVMDTQGNGEVAVYHALLMPSELIGWLP